MNASHSDLFKRSVTIEHVSLTSSQVLRASGTIENKSSRTWIRDKNDLGCYDSFAYRLTANNNSFSPIEKFLPFAEEQVPPGGKATFDWLIVIPQLTPIVTLHIDVVFFRQIALWFSSVGEPPAFMEIQVQPPNTPSPPFHSSFSSVAIRSINNSLSLVSGHVKNEGSESWISQGAVAGSSLIGFRIYDSPFLQNILFEGRGHLEQSKIRPGEQSQFSTRISRELIERGKYLKICMLQEQQFWFDERGSSSYLVDLAAIVRTPTSSDSSLPIFNANITVREHSIMHGFLLKVSGTLQNSGIAVWNPKGFNRSQPVRLGAKFYSANNLEAVREDRAELPSRPITPGEEIPFSFTMSLLGLTPGKYTVDLDLVHETVFWFSQQGAQKIALVIEVPQPPPQRTTNVNDISYDLPDSPQNTRVLFISPMLPLFDLQAGGKRMLEILSIMRGKGLHVDFVYESSSNVENPGKYIEALTALGINSIENVFEFLTAAKKNQYEACIIGWHSCAQKYLSLVRTVMPNAKVIIDTVDIHWVREARGVSSGELSFTTAQLEVRRQEEATIYEKADLLWVVTEADKEAVLEQNPSIQCQIIPLIYPPTQEKKRAFDSNDILFVGGFRHPPNVSAALRGAEICSLFNRHREKPSQYFIVGDSPPTEILALGDRPHVTVTGFVEELEPYFARARACIAPLTSGAGMKGKICDAVYEGVPVVTTAIGAEGLEFVDKKDFFLAETNNEFVAALNHLFSSEADAQSICQNAFNKISRLTSRSTVGETIYSSLIYRPVVIAIVTYNQRELLRRCLDSIIANTTYPRLTVHVFSNGCTDGTVDMLSEYQQLHAELITFEASKENLFFIKPNNHIITQYPGHDVVMINNDIEIITKNWLLHLYHAAYSSPFIAAAGGLVLDAIGSVSEAGATMDRNGYGKNIGRGSNPQAQELQRQRYVGFCSGCFLYLRRDALNAIGLLDEDFHPMYYEDAEWQYRALQHGLRTIYQPRCKVIHREGSSAGTDPSSGNKRYQEINREKFLKKINPSSLE